MKDFFLLIASVGASYALGAGLVAVVLCGL
jgi:hypothetical protein